MAASPRRQQPGVQPPRAKDPPPMVMQGDFRKVSGISTEIFRLIEQVENEHDATTAAALDTVERRGEMVVRILDPRTLGRFSAEAAKRFLQLQDSKHTVQLVEIVKRPGQTLGLYIREGNGLERSDGVFISRIALESAVYNSGCLQVGDEILAVNLVDVTRMSLDDVVIIMSIPRRLVLATRQRKGVRGAQTSESPLLPPREVKPPPVVVIKKHFEDLEQDENGIDRERGERERERERERDRQRDRERERERERERRPRSRLGLGLSPLSQDHTDHNGLDLYYNSRPADNSNEQWTYRPPPPPVVTEQPKPQHFTPYDRQYPKTLESLAEKVHSFYPGGPLDDRRGSPAYRSIGHGSGMDSRRVGNRVMPRSGSDQHLPRVEYDYSSSRLGRHTNSLMRPMSKANTLGHPGYTSRFSDSSRGYAPPSSTSMRDSSYSRRSRPPLDYSSDTEATIGPRSSLGYYRRGTSGSSSGVTGLPSGTLSRVGASSLRSNSLPRDRGRVPTGPVSRQSLVRFDRNLPAGLLDDDSDGALSAPEISSRRDRGTLGRIPNSPSVFTSDEYRAWLSRVPTSLLPRSTSSISHTGSQGLSGISRTPSTSAIYERIRAGRDAIAQQRAQRFTFSAENINLIDRNLEDSPYYSFRSGLSSTLDRPRPASTTPMTSGQSLLRSSSDFREKSNMLSNCADKNMRRMLQLMDLESRHIPNPTPRLQTDARSRLVDINPAEFLKYKVEKPMLQNATSISSLQSQPEMASDLSGSHEGMYGLLWVHLLAGRGLRASTQSVGAATMRDLYCVLECDRVHKARTVVRTGDIVFDWDETFELDLMGNRDLDLLIYSWDPQYRHKLCYKGSVHLVTLLKQSPVHQLALKIEPRGTLYLRLKYTDPQTIFQRKPSQQHILARPGSKAIHTGSLFGASLESVVNRENLSMGGMSSAQNNVPLIIKRCVEEIERRGLDIIGLYRLCGSATKKRILREALERGARTVDLTPDNVPDINVITGVLKDYLRELPEPLFTKCLYQMLVDVMSVCLPDDPEGNARLLFSILDCLPKVNRVTLVFLMDHLALVVSQSDRNKMTAQNISVIFGPILMLHAEPGTELDFNQPVTVLRYLLEIWKHQSVRDLACPASLASDKARPAPGGPAHSTPGSGGSKPPQPLPPYSKPLPGAPGSKQPPGPVVVTSPGSPTSESSRSSSSMSPPEDTEVLKSSKMSLANKNSQLVDSSSLSMLANKSPSQISLIGLAGSIGTKSPSQISLLGSNSSISSLARSNASISDQVKVFRSPFGSPNLSDRSKSPYFQNFEHSDRRNTNLSSRDVSKSPITNVRDLNRSPLKMEPSKPTMPTSLTSSQICENQPTEPKPMFSTLPRQRSIPTIIGMPRRLSEPRKSLPQVPSPKIDEFSQDIPKNPFEKTDDFSIPVNPTGKNPFLDEDEPTEPYAYDNVMGRVMSFEYKNGAGPTGQMYHTTIGQYGPVVTTNVSSAHKYSNPIMGLQYSVPVSSSKSMDANQATVRSGMLSSQDMIQTSARSLYDPNRPTTIHDSSRSGYDRPGMIREEVSETPTPSSSTGTDSSRKDVGRDGDVESDVDSEEDVEIAEQADVVPELSSKLY